MKRFVVILGVIATTITIFLTSSMVYPTRVEVDAKISGIQEQLKHLDKTLCRMEDKVDKIKDILIEIIKNK